MLAMGSHVLWTPAPYVSCLRMNHGGLAKTSTSGEAVQGPG